MNKQQQDIMFDALKDGMRDVVGRKFRIDFGSKKLTFTAGRRKYVELGDGNAVMTALFKFADGSVRPGIIIVDLLSSGEHGGTLLFLPDRVIEQGDADFVQALGKTREQVFPYKYKPDYHVPGNFHIGDDGWSM